MDQLSSMDASFLHLETPETPMHVGSLMLFELPEGYKGDYYEDVKALLGKRLHQTFSADGIVGKIAQRIHRRQPHIGVGVVIHGGQQRRQHLRIGLFHAISKVHAAQTIARGLLLQ